jgi:rhomboid protease GluP
MSAMLDPAVIGAPVRGGGPLLSPGQRVSSRLREFVRTAPATLGVVACLTAVWFLERALVGQVRGTRTIGYLALGALPNADIIGRGSPDQWWRFIGSGLIHDRTNPLHLVSNSLALLMVGSAIERLYGRVVFLGTLSLGVVAGGISWLLASELGFAAEPDYTIGCSAGICALVGMMLVYGYRHRASMDAAHAYSMKAQATLGIAVMLLIGLIVPNLNNVAHAGGLVCGAVLGAVVPSKLSAAGVGWRVRTFLWAVLLVSFWSVVFAGQNVIGRLLSHT